jgi:hypothetical protein
MRAILTSREVHGRKEVVACLGLLKDLQKEDEIQNSTVFKLKN